MQVGGGEGRVGEGQAAGEAVDQVPSRLWLVHRHLCKQVEAGQVERGM